MPKHPTPRRTALLAGLLALAACSGGDGGPPAVSGTEPEVDVTTGREPSVRDPLGYTGLPVDTNPYTTELDGEGLPGPGEMVEDDLPPSGF